MAGRRQVSGADESTTKGIGSVEHAGGILRALVEVGEARPLRDVAALAGMSPSKAWRYLLSFGRIGLVEQDPATGYYGLGPMALQLGLAALAGISVVKIGLPFLTDLRNAIGESVVLAVWADGGPTVIHIEESRRPVTLNVRAGSSLPLTDSAAGMVFAAFLPQDRVAELLAKEFRKNKTAITRQLDAVRAAGYSIVEGGLLPGVTAIGVPVFNHSGQIAAAIIAVGHIGVMDISEEGPVVSGLRSTSSALSQRLGQATNASG